MFIVYRRQADGLLKNSREIFKGLTAAEKTAEASSLSTMFSDNWEYTELSAVLAMDIRALGERAAYLVNGNVVSKPIFNASVDKTSIIANDTDKATLTVNVNDVGFVGQVVLWVKPPESAQAVFVSQAVAGATIFEITTEQLGTHELLVDVHEYGLKALAIEGVE